MLKNLAKWAAMVSVIAIAGCSQAEVSEAEGPSALRVPIDELSDYQRVAFEDGEIDFEEYEEALFSHLDCLRAEGIRVYDPVLETEVNAYSYVTDDPLPEEGIDLEAVMTSCEEEYLSEIEFGWAVANAPDPAEREAFYASVAACLREQGLTVADSSPPELARAYDAEPVLYEACFDQMRDAES